MTTVNKEIFKAIRTSDKVEVELSVHKPTSEEGRQAQRYYNKTFAEALTNGGLLRERVGSYMKEQGLWDDAKEQKQKDFVKQLTDMDLRIKGGGIKLSDARKIALEMRQVRADFRDLLATKNSLDASTVEGQAENARFNALVALCLVYNDGGEKYYQSVDDYLEHSSDPEAFQAASLLGQIMFHLDKNYENSLPENKFLAKFKFVDEELRLINKDGHLVDEEGRLIDETGRYIAYTGEVDANGKPKSVFVDKYGKSVAEDGSYIASDAKPFLDDDGNPIVDTPATTTETSEPVQAAS